MEKKDWKQRLGSYDSWAMNESMFITIDGETIYTLDELLDFIQQELDKAREDGYENGVNDGMKGRVFKRVEIKEEAHIPKELIEKIREEGYEKGYERGVKYGTTGNTLTDSDIEEFERLDKKARERFLKSIY